MEAAHRTLQDAAGLAQLSANVEDVFASGDLTQAAETLASMRHCLAVIGEVPEFANVKRQLETLEDRLEGMVQPRLSEALSQRKVEESQALRSILITIAHYKFLEQQYTRVRLKPLRRMWEEFETGKGNIALSQSSRSEKKTGEKHSMAITVASSGTPTLFSDWLSQFYDEVLLAVEQEWKWCLVAFPEDYKTLVPKLLTETMLSISTSFGVRIDSSALQVTMGARTCTLDGGLLGEGTKVERIQGAKLELLILLHNITGTFARNVQHLLATVDPADLVSTLRAIYLPYEMYKQRYGELEQSLLFAELGALDLRGAVSRGVGARGVELSETVRRMESSIPAVLMLLEAAVERCLTFTGGSEAEALLRTLDDAMLQYLAILQEVLKSLRTVCGVDLVTQELSTLSGGKKEAGMEGVTTKKELASGSTVLDIVSDEEEWAIVQGVLQLLMVADSLSSRSAVFEASLRSTLNRLGGQLRLPNIVTSTDQVAASGEGTIGAEVTIIVSGGPSVFDMALLRLVDGTDKVRRLNNLLEQTKDPRFHALAHTSQRLGAFIEAVNDLVYDVLIAKVRSRLADVAHLPIWGAEEEENVFDLPNFSAYASTYISSIGEYLLTLPQQLEPLVVGEVSGVNGDVGEESAEEGQFFATEWMFKVAEGTTSLYVDQLRGIQFLSDRGARQLTADIDYLCKVLSALSMQVPPVLTTFQACISVPKEKLLEIAKSDATIQLDMPTTKLICKMRQVSLDP
eukprot:c25323_g1_i1 orf=411-2639(+)